MKKTFIIILGIFMVIVLSGAACQKNTTVLNEPPIDQAREDQSPEAIPASNQPIAANLSSEQGAVQGAFDENDYLDEALLELEGVGKD